MEDVGVKDERAQIILIGAFLIAIGVLAALLIINDIGFSQTIAKQDGGEDGFESLEFSNSADRAVSEAMTGNGTTPSNASVRFEKYIDSYSNETNDAFLTGAASADVTPDTSKINTAWMVGQRDNGTFKNARGDNEWIMVENIPSPDDNIRGRFELNVSDMRDTNPKPLFLNGTEEGTFNSLTTLLDPKAWTLKMRINDSTGDPILNLNMTARENVTLASGLEVTDFDQEKTNIAGNDTVTVDVFNQTVNGDSSGFPSGTNYTDGSDVNPDESDGFKFDNASKGEGTYEFRFDSDVTKTELNSSSTGDPKGPCTHPNGPPCRSVDGTEKHIVGVVHNVTAGAADLEYTSRSTSYESTVGGMTLDAGDVNLNQIENVDGAASFNIEILKTTSPGQEEDSGGSGGEGIEIVYKVENTGTQEGKQDVNLTVPGANPNPNRIENATDVVVSANSQIRSDNTNDNVSWGAAPNPAPEFGKNGTYTAFVVSENSTTGEKTVDSTVISVDKNKGGTREPGIPNSPVGFALPSWVPMVEAAAVAEGGSR